MTTEPIAIPIAPDNGMEETPAGPMSTEWLDAVWDELGRIQPYGNFSVDEFALLAQMQGVSAQDAAKRLCGEGEE